MSMSLGHHRNADRVDEGTNEETSFEFFFFVPVHLHHVHVLCSMMHIWPGK